MRHEVDHQERLSEPEALRLLSSVPIGRIVFTIRALPAIHPVNFALIDGDVVIRIGVGSTLAAAVAGSVVAFQADEIDLSAHTGWTVTVTGRARLVTDPAEVAWLREHGPTPWAPGIKESFIRIRPEVVTGRRIPATHQAQPLPR